MGELNEPGRELVKDTTTGLYDGGVAGSEIATDRPDRPDWWTPEHEQAALEGAKDAMRGAPEGWHP
jgi:hypothetical protein